MANRNRLNLSPPFWLLIGRSFQLSQHTSAFRPKGRKDFQPLDRPQRLEGFISNRPYASEGLRPHLPRASHLWRYARIFCSAPVATLLRKFPCRR